MKEKQQWEKLVFFFFGHRETSSICTRNSKETNKQTSSPWVLTALALALALFFFVFFVRKFNPWWCNPYHMGLVQPINDYTKRPYTFVISSSPFSFPPPSASRRNTVDRLSLETLRRSLSLSLSASRGSSTEGDIVDIKFVDLNSNCCCCCCWV